MDIRFTVGLIFIAVGALLALLGGIAVFNGAAALLGGKEGPDATFTFGCGGIGAFGVLLVLLGLRLRNRAVAAAPELRRALENRDSVPTTRTGTAKPRFLEKGDSPQPQPQPTNRLLGLTACAWAESLGLTAIACDVSDARLAQAARFGARHLAKPDALADLVKSVTRGRGADVALELSGSPEASRAAVEVLRIGGTAVWVGAVFPTEPVPLFPEQVIRRCLTVTGVHNYAPHDLAAAVRFLAANHARFPFAELVSRSFPLGEVNDAFAFAEAERPVRVAVACG